MVNYTPYKPYTPYVPQKNFTPANYSPYYTSSAFGSSVARGGRDASQAEIERARKQEIRSFVESNPDVLSREKGIVGQGGERYYRVRAGLYLSESQIRTQQRQIQSEQIPSMDTQSIQIQTKAPERPKSFSEAPKKQLAISEYKVKVEQTPEQQARSLLERERKGEIVFGVPKSEGLAEQVRSYGSGQTTKRQLSRIALGGEGAVERVAREQGINVREETRSVFEELPSGQVRETRFTERSLEKPVEFDVGVIIPSGGEIRNTGLFNTRAEIANADARERGFIESRENISRSLFLPQISEGIRNFNLPAVSLKRAPKIIQTIGYETKEQAGALPEFVGGAIGGVASTPFYSDVVFNPKRIQQGGIEFIGGNIESFKQDPSKYVVGTLIGATIFSGVTKGAKIGAKGFREYLKPSSKGISITPSEPIFKTGEPIIAPDNTLIQYYTVKKGTRIAVTDTGAKSVLLDDLVLESYSRGKNIGGKASNEPLVVDIIPDAKGGAKAIVRKLKIDESKGIYSEIKPSESLLEEKTSRYFGTKDVLRGSPERGYYEAQDTLFFKEPVTKTIGSATIEKTVSQPKGITFFEQTGFIKLQAPSNLFFPFSEYKLSSFKIEGRSNLEYGSPVLSAIPEFKPKITLPFQTRELAGKFGEFGFGTSASKQSKLYIQKLGSLNLGASESTIFRGVGKSKKGGKIFLGRTRITNEIPKIEGSYLGEPSGISFSELGQRKKSSQIYSQVQLEKVAKIFQDEAIGTYSGIAGSSGGNLIKQTKKYKITDYDKPITETSFAPTLGKTTKGERISNLYIIKPKVRSITANETVRFLGSKKVKISGLTIPPLEKSKIGEISASIQKRMQSQRQFISEIPITTQTTITEETSKIIPPSLPFKEFPPFVGFPPFPKAGASPSGLGSFKFPRPKRFERTFRYQPSLKSILFDIRGSIPKQGVFSGLEERPLPRLRTRRRVKRKKRR